MNKAYNLHIQNYTYLLWHYEHVDYFAVYENIYQYVDPQTGFINWANCLEVALEHFISIAIICKENYANLPNF